MENAMNMMVEVNEPVDQTNQKAELDLQEYRKTLDTLTPVLEAIPAEEIRQPRAAGMRLVQRGFAYDNSLEEDKPLFMATFNPETVDVTVFESIRERSVAFWEAEIQLTQHENQFVLPRNKILEKVTPLREKLLDGAKYIWGKDPEKADILKSISAGRSHLDKADDLARLAVLFKENWSEAQGSCAVTRGDVEEATTKSTELMSALAGPPEEQYTAIQDLRNRAYEYLRRALEEIRQAAEFVFRHQSEKLRRYPKLHALEKKRKAKSQTDQNEAQDSANQPTTETQVTPSPASPSVSTTDPIMVN